MALEWWDVPAWERCDMPEFTPAKEMTPAVAFATLQEFVRNRPVNQGPKVYQAIHCLMQDIVELEDESHFR